MVESAWTDPTNNTFHLRDFHEFYTSVLGPEVAWLLGGEEEEIWRHQLPDTGFLIVFDRQFSFNSNRSRVIGSFHTWKIKHDFSFMSSVGCRTVEKLLALLHWFVMANTKTWLVLGAQQNGSDVINRVTEPLHWKERT